MKNTFNAISLFSGGGGLDLGFKAAGFKVRFAADILPEACETLRFNNPSLFVYGPPYHSGDVHELTKEFIFEHSGMNKGDVDIIIGGPPCQPFSVAAAQRYLQNDENFKRKGFSCPKNGDLIFEYLRLIKELEPKVFVIENVPGLVKIDKGKTVASLKETLSLLGYFLNDPIFVQMSKYGIPQNRERVFLVGSKVAMNFKLPEKAPNTSSPHHYLPITTAQALCDLSDDAPNHSPRIHKDDSVSRYRQLEFGKRDKLGRVDRLHPNAPSKTIIAGGSKGGGRSHLHPFLARTLTVRESARLQTFPDDYVFTGKVGRQFTQVGNAVPPLFAEILGRAIMEQFFSVKHEAPLKYKRNYVEATKANDLLLKKALSDKNYFTYFNNK